MAKSKEPRGETTAAIIGAVFGIFVEKLLPLERFADEFSNLLRVFFVAMMVVFAWKAWRYYEILGGADEPHGSWARDDYNSLRQELTEGGKPAKVYANWLTLALDRVDKFFGDAGRNDPSWFARMFGLETPGPRWTAPAFDKCLLLALIYPVLTIYAVWIWSGEVGVAEEALRLPRLSGGYSGLWGGLFGLGMVIETYAIWRGRRAKGFMPMLLWLAFAFAAALAVSLGVAAAFAVAPGVVGALAGASAVLIISEWSIQRGHQGIFLLLFVPTLLLAAFAGAYFLSPLESWITAGVLLLVFGVLTLVNAPFDWVAIGLTRALLRRGLAPGGCGPYFYALIDAIVAVPLIMLLSFVTVVAVQTFDDIAVLRAGSQARIMPLCPLFERLENNPGDATLWWIWLMLFSTLVPSLCNLVIGAAAFMRGLPFMNNWILSRMPIGKAMRDSERSYVASALAGQLVGGMLTSGVLLYLLAAYAVPFGLPAFGAYIRDFSETLAAYNAPARLMMWFAGSR